MSFCENPKILKANKTDEIIVLFFFIGIFYFMRIQKVFVDQCKKFFLKLAENWESFLKVKIKFQKTVF